MAKVTLKKTREPSEIRCAKPVKGRYVLLRSRSEIGGGPWATVAEIGVVGTATGDRPETSGIPRSAPYILTPKPGPEPKITGPRVFGVRPGAPFLFTVTATGTRPMKFSAKGLPAGLEC